MITAHFGKRPGLDGKLLRQAVRQHALIFFLMLGLGMLFIGVSAALFFRFWATGESREVLSLIFLLVFFISGLFIVGFTFYSTVSSTVYYYQKGRLRQHGLNLNAQVISKTRDATVAERRDETRHISIDELELQVGFRFDYGGQTWECADLLTREALFDALSVGQSIPVRILPWKPRNAIIRQRALLNQLKRTNNSSGIRDPRIGTPLMESDRV
nr:hypothetical protein [uncultured Enterobacter sp.]